MADNDNFNADEFGNYSNWLELYNGDTEAVFLADYYLTDKLDNPDKWQMPEFYLEPGAFILFWAEDEESSGENHTNFKLSKGGEAIGIFNRIGAPVDTLTFGEQDTDVSYGRLPDGRPEWIYFTAATPGESNEFSTTFEWQSRASFGVFPNPANGSHLYFPNMLNIQLYSLQGQLLLVQQYAKQLDISRLAPGMYLLRSDGHQPVLLVRE